MADRGSEILIIGGGLQGCAIALFLARAGARVSVVEKDLAGRHASGVNAGGLRLLMRDIREYPLSQRAMTLWEHLSDIVGSAGADASEVRLGTAQIAISMDAEELAWSQARADDMQRRGIQTEKLVGPEELHRLLPGLSPLALGGLVSDGDGHANPANAARAFRNAAVAAGVRVFEGRTVSGLRPGNPWRVETSAGPLEADLVVNCAGAWGASIAASLDEPLPLKVMALTMMVTERVQPFVTPVVIGIDRPLSFKQSAVGSLVIGGGISGKPCLDQGTSFTVMDRMAYAANATIEAFPSLAGISILRTWTGLEGATPDGVPYIGPSAVHDRLWHVFGFCGHGFQISPAVGETVARSLLAGQVDPRLMPFGVRRFSRQPALNDEAP